MSETPVRPVRAFVAATVAALSVSAAPGAAEVIDLSGETVTIVHNASPGGATGLSAQVLADAWAKTMEGDPTVVVQAVPGGALTKGINQVMNARPNGLTIGYLAWQGSTRILDPEPLQIPFQDFGMIGGVGGANFFLHVDSEVAESGDAFAELDAFSFGGFSPKSAPSMQTAGALDLLGIDWNFVSGFGGDGPLLAAMERGEVDGYAATAVIYNAQLKDGPIADGESIGVWHFGFPTEEGGMAPDPAFGGEIPTLAEYLEQQTGEAPSGPAWDMIMFHARVSAPVSWIVVAPPGTPAAHVEMLQRSFVEAVESEEYQAQAAQVFRGAPNIEYADEMTAIVEEVQGTSEELKETMRDYISRMEG
jgi:tripartite-type tricarboxylate transporter receptor subunit TctC